MKDFNRVRCLARSFVFVLNKVARQWRTQMLARVQSKQIESDRNLCVSTYFESRFSHFLERIVRAELVTVFKWKSNSNWNFAHFYFVCFLFFRPVNFAFHQAHTVYRVLPDSHLQLQLDARTFIASRTIPFDLDCLVIFFTLAIIYF
jgi:hypothetical protein